MRFCIGFWFICEVWFFLRLIVVDGLDAVGKDTHAELIKKRYEDRGEYVVVRSHPSSDNFFGRVAKKALLGQGMVDRVKASLFYALDVLRSIKKYYGSDKYDTVILVRYLVGTAYLPLWMARFLYGFFKGFVPTSEYMFFLDAPPDVLLERIALRKQVEMFETAEKLVKVRSRALALVEGWNVVDTTGSVKETFEVISDVLDRFDKN